MIDRLIEMFKSSGVDRIEASKLYNVYINGCKKKNVEPKTQNAFGRIVGKKLERKKSNGLKYYTSGTNRDDLGTIEKEVGMISKEAVTDKFDPLFDGSDGWLEVKECKNCGRELEIDEQDYCCSGCYYEATNKW